MERREQREKLKAQNSEPSEAARTFDAVLREKLVAGGLTPRGASFLERDPAPEGQHEGEHES
jgi:hypothetical protein